ncbi:PLP-dependent transferase, partial [Klebsiella pneumoniae subsp. pneumoniae]
DATDSALEAKVNLMEGGKGTVSFATGMAALAAIFTTLLRRGDHLVSSQYVFGNTNSLLGTLLELGVEITFVVTRPIRRWRPRSISWKAARAR